MSTNGFETVEPFRETSIGESANAPTISNADSIWLEAFASISTLPPFKPHVWITKGKAFSSPKNSNFAPCDFNASTSPAIGLSLIHI